MNEKTEIAINKLAKYYNCSVSEILEECIFDYFYDDLLKIDTISDKEING